MDNSLAISEVVWRGPWILVIMENEDEAEALKFDTAFVRILWEKENLELSGIVRTLTEYHDKDPGARFLEITQMLVEMGDTYGGENRYPTRIEVTYQGHVTSFKIKKYRKDEDPVAWQKALKESRQKIYILEDPSLLPA